jgi:RNA polymerase sigma factor (sigma-70 family)
MGGRHADAVPLGGLGAVAHLGVIANLSDAQLLDHFLAREGEVGEAAFEALVARHGAMVFGVCRSVLRDPHEAQDAFQATFLVLAARAGSIRQRETIGGWLLGVARRVSLRSRGDLARQRAREARAAAIQADRPADRAESWQELHEEIGRLPGRFREPVVLCYLEGLSADAAAVRLGCPRGTVLSRLSRARERLRGRLMRRGLAPGFGLLEAGRLPASLPQGLVSTTVRASLSFADHATVAAGLATGPAVALARGVIRTMTISRLKVIFAAVMIGALVPGGLWAFGGILGRQRAEKPDAAAAAARAPGGKEADRPGVRHVDRIDFDQLYAGAIAEARPAFEFVGNVDPGLALKIDVPRFAVVRDVRCLRSDERSGGGVRCIVTIGLDTRSVGTRAGELKVRLGDREARVPVAAKVKPAEAGRPKVLIISHGFGAMGDSADYYRPWFDLARDAGLDVSYMDTDSVPVPSGAGGPPEELSRYDVILLDDGGVAGLGKNASY